MKKTGRVLPVLTALCIAVLGIGLLTGADAVSDGIRRGLSICGGVLIPSLFPFMVLATFLSMTDYARILSVPLRPLTTRLFRLPAELGVVVLLSLVGGYPVGAKMIAGLLEQGRISRATAERMLCFCVNSGPSFLIVAVGGGMFLDRRAGVILFATQTAATLLIGLLVSRRVPAPTASRPAPRTEAGAALVGAVQGATSAMLLMCAFAILFSGLLAMLEGSGLLQLLPLRESVARAVVGGFLEVTTGCIAAAEVGGVTGFALVSGIISFSGLSVLFQIMSCFRGQPVRFRPLVLSRIAHAGISSAIAVPLLAKFCSSSAVWNPAGLSVLQADAKTTLISVCLLGMCCIFTLSIRTRESTY